MEQVPDDAVIAVRQSHAAGVFPFRPLVKIASASRVLNRPQKGGFVEPVRGHLEPTAKGGALAMATAASPLRRETASRLIAGLIERTRALNADERWAYRVGMVVVFG